MFTDEQMTEYFDGLVERMKALTPDEWLAFYDSYDNSTNFKDEEHPPRYYREQFAYPLADYGFSSDDTQTIDLNSIMGVNNDQPRIT